MCTNAIIRIIGEGFNLQKEKTSESRKGLPFAVKKKTKTNTNENINLTLIASVVTFILYLHQMILDVFLDIIDA